MAMLHGLTFALLLPLLAQATNDWSTPCHSGKCSYDLSNTTTTGHARGSVTISGNLNAIADLTPAAGWQVLDCDPSASSQNHTFRAICLDPTGVCEHLYKNGAVNTIVRLPENCTVWPFARIVTEWTHENQTVPADVASSPSRRATLPTVRGITVDTEWDQVDVNHHGPVNVTIEGSSGDDVDETQVSSRDVYERGIFDGLKNLNSFNVDKSSTKTLDVDKTFELVDMSKHCPAEGSRPAYDLSLKVDVVAKAHAQVKYGVSADGTIIPPKVKNFQIYADLDATLNGGLTVDAAASISWDSGKLEIFQVGIPGLDFPGILTIGPTFEVYAHATAQAQADLKLNVDLAYQISGARLAFPSGSSAGQFTPSPSNLKLSANPQFSATGNVAAHLTPTIAFGINALKGYAKADVNLNIDAYAQLDLSLNAAHSKEEGFTANGCVDVKTGLTVQAVAEGSFFNIFNQNTKSTLYEHEWPLWGKCFGNSRRREHARALLGAPSIRRSIAARDLLCSDAEDVIGEGRDTLVDDLITDI